MSRCSESSIEVTRPKDTVAEWSQPNWEETNMAQFSRKLVAATLSAAAAVVIGGLFTSPAQAQGKTYECWNPAICRAVCGKAICGGAVMSSQREAQYQKQARFRKTALQQAPRSGAGTR